MQTEFTVQNRLSGTALITGGSSGLGLTFAKSLADKGVNLVLVARNEQRLKQVCQELQTRYGVQCEYIVANLLDRLEVEKVKERIVLTDTNNPITILVNNAGAGCYSRLATTDFAPIASAAQLMALTPMELGGAAAASMLERGSGLIITTASVQALVPMGAYAAIKSMIKVWSDSLAVELQGTGVQALTLLPGWVRTEFHARTGVSNSSIPNWVWLDPELVVAQTLRAIMKGKTQVIPSKKFQIISFLAKHAPAALVGKVARKLNKGRR